MSDKTNETKSRKRKMPSDKKVPGKESFSKVMSIGGILDYPD